MSEFRKDGGGDFDKRGGATPPSSGSGASGIDPFGFKHEVQAALRAEHRPSPEVMDLIQRWRIPEHVARAVQGKVSENLGQHLSFQELLTKMEWRDHHSVSRGRSRPSLSRPSLRAIVPFSLEDLPKRGYPLLQGIGGFQVLFASSVEEQWTVLAPMWPHHRHELRADGWNVVEFGTLDASPSQMLTDLNDAMERLEGITVSLGECSGVPNCPECGQGLEPLSYMHTPISIRWNGAKPHRTLAGCRLLSSLPRSGTQHIAHWQGTLQSQSEWNSLEAVPDAEHHSGLLVDSSVYGHLPALVVNHAPHQQNGASTLEYRLLPKRAHEVEVPACHGCRIVVPEHVRQVDTLVLDIPYHVLLRWLM